MSEQSEALRLADLYARSCVLGGGILYGKEREVLQDELRRQHSRIGADEALMRQAAKVIGDASWHIPEGSPLDLEAEAAITVLRTRLEQAK